MSKKKPPTTIEECNAEMELTQKKIRQYENRNKMLDRKLAIEKRKERNHRLCSRGGYLESLVPALIDMSEQEARDFLYTAVFSDKAQEFLRKRAGEATPKNYPCTQGHKGALIHPNGRVRSAEGFISAPGIIALCRDWRLAPRQGNLHFPCDSLRCLPFCVPHESEHLALQAIHFHGVLLTVSGGDTIAIYHCSIKIVSRGKGKSAVAAAAYRAGEKLTNEWDGLTHDYTRKGGVVHSEIMLPPHAPPSFSDRSILWNSVEQIEKSNNSQLAREIEIALPVELSREEQTRLVREYCSSQFVSKGMCADFNIHDTGNGNPHAHILLTMRPLDEKGTWAAKSKKEYVLDENGERVKLPSGRYKTRKVDLMDWNRQENADLWRKAWADLANDYLERSGSAERIDHRSHAERGIEELPTVHMGVAASQMEKKGIATDKGEINRMIQKTNRLMREIRGYIDSLKEWLAEVFAAKKQLQAAPHSPDIATLLTRYLSIEREKSRKYSQGWQQQHTAGELQKISKAIVYLQSKGIATLEDLDAALSSVDEEAKRLNTSVVAKQKRMRTLEKFIEHGSNYNRLKPIHDELKTLKNGWGKKREKFEQAHESDLIIWNAANRFLHANLPEGTKSFKVSEWQKEFDELKAQSTGEYEELKTKRSEVKELQQIRKCIDIVEQAEQRTQEQTHQTPRRKKEDISL